MELVHSPPAASPLEVPILEAQDLSKRYEDGVLALDNVSFAVPSGHLYAMLGGNGAGKSTDHQHLS